MTGTVTINGVTYQVGIPDLTPADILPVFRTDTSILKTDSILLHAAGAQQNSAKKVLLPHLIAMVLNAVGGEVALTIKPYYDENDEYQGMYWHFNGQWLRRTDTGEMIRVDDSAAEIALAAEQAVEATVEAKAAIAAANNTEARVSQAEEARVQAENLRVRQASEDHSRAEQDHQTAVADHSTAQGDHTRSDNVHSHPPYIADGTTAHPGDIGYFYSWDYATQQYVRGAKLSLDVTTLTQAQYNQLVEDMKAYVTAPYGVFVGETLAFTGGAMHVGETLVVSERGEFSGEMLVLS